MDITVEVLVRCEASNLEMYLVFIAKKQGLKVLYLKARVCRGKKP